MCLKYYVVDDTMELTIQPQKNSGYDPVRTIIRRQKIPKNYYKDLVRMTFFFLVDCSYYYTSQKKSGTSGHQNITQSKI